LLAVRAAMGNYGFAARALVDAAPS
jgi:hypothetical protein